MNGVHDMGGMHNMGPVVREENEPPFHAKWERRCFGLTLAAGFLGKWNIDMSRFARERMPPAAYLAASYYERWLFAVQQQLLETGCVTAEELASVRAGRPKALAPAPADARVLHESGVDKALRNRRAARMEDPVPPRFKPGDRVVARNINPMGHTRLPRYARGKRGVIDRDHGVFIFPDAAAAGQGKVPQHCYGVRFAARELWGDEVSPRHAVYVDCFEPYLDPA